MVQYFCSAKAASHHSEWCQFSNTRNPDSSRLASEGKVLISSLLVSEPALFVNVCTLTPCTNPNRSPMHVTT